MVLLWMALAGTAAAAECPALFDSRQIVTLEISIDPSEWERLLATARDADDPGFLSAKLRCEDDRALTVGIRRVPDGSDPERVALGIAIDRFVGGQTLDGLAAFALFAGGRPPEATGPGRHPRGFFNVVVNGQHVGLFTGVPGRADDHQEGAGPRERRSLKIAGAQGAAQVVINEVLANTPGGDDVEYIELYNAGSSAQDLTGWYLLDDDDLHQTCPLAGMLGPGEFLVVPGIHERFVASFPGVTNLNAAQFDSLVAGQGFGLGNAQDTIRLFRSVEGVVELVDLLTYGRQGVGVAFGYRPEDSDAAEYLASPSPGATNDTSALHSPVCINEFQTTSLASPVDDWVELYNRSDTTVDIGGWFLSDDAGTPLRYVFPAGTVIPPGGFLTVDELTLGFSFSSSGTEVILLTHADGTTGQDYFDFGPQFADVSQGRFPDGSPNWHYFVEPTRGSSNTCEAGPSAPGPVAGLAFSSQATLAWNPAAGAEAYDIVQGDLLALLDAAGDFSAAITGCAGNNRTLRTVLTTDTPAPGQASFYLVRGVHFACGFGSYDSGSPTQAAGRDASITVDPDECP